MQSLFIVCDKKKPHKYLLEMTMLNEYKTCNIQFLTVIIYRIR